jgi:aminopeptidase N
LQSTVCHSKSCHFPGISSLSDKEYVAVVIAHELAHQWFGDLGIISYFTYKNLKLNNLENEMVFKKINF